MIGNVRLIDHNEGWILRWSGPTSRHTPTTKNHEKVLYAIDTEEEAIQDVLDYFGGLVKREDITVINRVNHNPRGRER